MLTLYIVGMVFAYNYGERIKTTLPKILGHNLFLFSLGSWFTFLVYLLIKFYDED